MSSVDNVSKKVLWTLKLEKAIEYLTYLMILLFYTGKVFQVFTVVIDILFLVLLYLRQDQALFTRHKTLLNSFGLFFIYLAFQSLFANNIQVALLSSVGMIRFVILFFALWYVFDTQEKIKRLIYSISIIIGFLFVDVSYQYFSGTDLFGYPLFGGLRLTAWDTKAKLAMYIPIFTGAVIASILILKKKWIAWLTLLLLLLMVFFSGNKGPLLYLTGSIFVVLLVSKTYRKYLIPVLLVLGMFMTIAIMTNDQISARFSQFKNPLSAQNTSGRNQIYETAVEMIKDRPLLGIGTKNFRYEFPSYYKIIYDKKQKKDHYDNMFVNKTAAHVHSMLLSFLINWGLIGTLIFVYILYQIYRQYVRNNDVALLTSIGLLYCIAPFNFGNTIVRSQWQFYIFLSLSFIVILGSYKQLKRENTSMSKVKNENS